MGIHHNLLRPTEKSDKNYKNPSKLNMALVNIQSLKPKLDMLIQHMQVNNIDMVFVTETWTQDGNESEHQYIKANIKHCWIQYTHPKQRKLERRNCDNI